MLAGIDQSLAAIAPTGPRRQGDAGMLGLGAVDPIELRNVYAACDVLVLPSIATRTFREPWGLVVNEAMNRGLPVIASDAVGAAAGGLVRDEANGLVVAAGDSDALAARNRAPGRGPAVARPSRVPGSAATCALIRYDAWAEGFSDALASLDLARGRW